MTPRGSTIAKFLFASVFICGLFATLLTGCGGSNNPSGASGLLPDGSQAGIAPSVASGTVNLTASLIDVATNDLIQNSNANIMVTIRRVGTAALPSKLTDENKAFAFYNLPQGYYFITIEDDNDQYAKVEMVRELSEPEVHLTIRLSPTDDTGVVRLNFHGKALDALGNPVMFGTVTVENSAGATFETSTLFDGSFAFGGISSGSYSVTFSKPGFESTTRLLRLDDSGIRFETSKLNSTTDRITFPAGTTDPQAITNLASTASYESYNIGSVTLAPLWAETGAIAGVLLDSNLAGKPPFANTSFDLVYDNNITDSIAPQSIIKSFTTDSQGYFSAKNLPAGWYLVARPGYTTTPIIDGSGSIVGYSFGAGDLVFDVWMEVKPGSVTPIPQEN